MISLNVNGGKHQVDASPDTPLMWILRENLGFTGVKFGCGIGECGACTVLIDGEAVRSCTVSAGSAQNREIMTIEGLPESHPVKQTWIAQQVPQCGYCQPGMMLQAVDFLNREPNPTNEEIAEAMDDVICRCGSHPRVMIAMKSAADLLKAGRDKK